MASSCLSGHVHHSSPPGSDTLSTSSLSEQQASVCVCVCVHDFIVCYPTRAATTLPSQRHRHTPARLMQTLTLISITSSSRCQARNKWKQQQKTKRSRRLFPPLLLLQRPLRTANPSALVRRPTLFYFRSTFKFLIWIDYGGVGVAAAEIMNALGEGELKHY